MTKKAAIELSVTAIVVLILAIVILGLGLGFIRGMFGKVATQFEQQIAAEPEPPTTSGSDSLTLSRESIITNAGNSEVLKIGVYNPTSEDWVAESAWICNRFTTEAECGGTQVAGGANKPQFGCYWSTTSTIKCQGTAKTCIELNTWTLPTGYTTTQSACVVQKGCMWNSTGCENSEGAVPMLTCNTMTTDPTAQVNAKPIRQGESATFNYLMTIPKNTPESAYLCSVEVRGYQKDLTIRVTR